MKPTLPAVVVCQATNTAAGAIAGRLTGKLYVAYKCVERFFYSLWTFKQKLIQLKKNVDE